MSKKNETERTLSISSSIRALDTAMKQSISNATCNVGVYLDNVCTITYDIMQILIDAGKDRLVALGLFKELRSHVVKLYSMLGALYDLVPIRGNLAIKDKLANTSHVVFCAMKQFMSV